MRLAKIFLRDYLLSIYLIWPFRSLTPVWFPFQSSPTEEHDPLALRPQNGIANLLGTMIRVSTNPLEKEDNVRQEEENRQAPAKQDVLVNMGQESQKNVKLGQGTTRDVSLISGPRQTFVNKNNAISSANDASSNCKSRTRLLFPWNRGYLVVCRKRSH